MRKGESITARCSTPYRLQYFLLFLTDNGAGADDDDDDDDVDVDIDGINGISAGCCRCSRHSDNSTTFSV